MWKRWVRKQTRTSHLTTAPEVSKPSCETSGFGEAPRQEIVLARRPAKQSPVAARRDTPVPAAERADRGAAVREAAKAGFSPPAAGRHGRNGTRRSVGVMLMTSVFKVYSSE